MVVINVRRMDIYCMVTDSGLVPMYDSDLEERKKLKRGDRVLCRITKPRNYEFHKKFFALVRLTYENLPEHLHSMLRIRSEEDMLTSIKLELGYADKLWYSGKQIAVPKSISFAAMDQAEFERFFARAVDLVLTLYLRGTDRKELLDEVDRFR